MKIGTKFILFAPFVEGFADGSRSIAGHFAMSTNNPSNEINMNLRKHVFAEVCSKLSQVSLPDTEDESNNVNQSDPVQSLTTQLGSKNFDAIINVSILSFVLLSALNQVATIDAEITRGWTTEEMVLRIPIDIWLSYSAVLNQSPILTKAATSATVYTIGDIIAQGSEGKGIGDIDRLRILRSLVAGLIGHGPMSHVWYDVSEKVFENVMHLQQGIAGTAIKVAIDQSLWGPIWNNTYILLLGLMKFDKIEVIIDEMKRTTIPLLVSGLKLWPLAHCVTYGLVPVENRLLWVDLVEIFWVTILASTAAGSAHGALEDVPDVQGEEVKAKLKS